PLAEPLLRPVLGEVLGAAPPAPSGSPLLRLLHCRPHDSRPSQPDPVVGLPERRTPGIRLPGHSRAPPPPAVPPRLRLAPPAALHFQEAEGRTATEGATRQREDWS